MPASNVTLTPIYVDYTVVGAATWASLGGNEAAYKLAVQTCLDNLSHGLYLSNGGAKTFFIQIGLNAYATFSADTVGQLIPGGGVATNADYAPQGESYITLRGELIALSLNSIQQLAFNITNLPVSDPTGGGGFTIQSFLATSLGKINLSDMHIIGSIGFKPATYTDTDPNGLGAGTNVYEAILHEGSELLGRTANSVLWWWGSAGSRQGDGTLSHYFALDQGSTASKIYQLSTSPDYYDTTGAQTAFAASILSGAVSRSSSLPGMAADWQYLTALGFTLTDGVGGGQDWAGIPINSVAPTITGSTTQGQTLSISSNGTWTNSPTYTYQWLQDGVAIGGATSSTYATVSGDIGHNISLSLTGTGASTWLNSTVTSSNSIGPIGNSTSTSFSFGLKR